MLDEFSRLKSSGFFENGFSSKLRWNMEETSAKMLKVVCFDKQEPNLSFARKWNLNNHFIRIWTYFFFFYKEWNVILFFFSQKSWIKVLRSVQFNGGKKKSRVKRCGMIGQLSRIRVRYSAVLFRTRKKINTFI